MWREGSEGDQGRVRSGNWVDIIEGYINRWTKIK